VNLPSPAKVYDPSDQAQTRAAIRQADGENFKRGRDVEIGDGRLILTSPNGTRWNITIDNTGALIRTSL
jgi:hypothetical protein